MKIVQSSWSCKQNNLLQFAAGWRAPEYNLMGWALSCLQLKKYYDDVTLYADTVSAKMLIDTLRLPYNNVVCNLDELNTYDARLWALPKIHTYARQSDPFLHVDSDVFIWKPFEKNLLNSGLIAQNMEAATDYYTKIMQSLEAELSFFPDEIIQDRKNNNLIYAYNAGIFGGHDLDFFQLYTQKAYDFIDKNVHNLLKIEASNFNIFFEQYLFYCLVKSNKKSVNLLLSDIIGDNQYIGFGDFIEVPHNKHFLHLLGVYKRNKMVCEQMANRLRADHPEYYYRIIALFKNSKVPLKKDYYHFIGTMSESSLASRYHILKARNGGSFDNAHQRKACTTPDAQFRTKLAEDTIDRIRMDVTLKPEHEHQEHLKDIKQFEKKLADIIQEKFTAHSYDCLYSRDIIHTSYFRSIFEDHDTGYHTNLIADNVVEIITNKFDWSEVDLEEVGQRKLIQQLMADPSQYHTAVVPECDTIGYTLTNVDDLDMMLLELLQQPATVAEILQKITSAFDPKELAECRAEYELLITGRIKMALQTKLIKIA